jgi:hypothetical protein
MLQPSGGQIKGEDDSVADRGPEGQMMGASVQ